MFLGEPMNTEKIINFKMPRYNELPAIELYVDQVLKYVELTFAPLEIYSKERALTNAMVNNYVKQGVVPRPVKKRYSRVHIAYLMIAYLSKQIFTIDEIAQMIKVQNSCFDIETTNNYMCDELENILRCIFTGKTPSQDSTKTNAPQRFFVRSTLIAFANKIYVQELLQEYAKDTEE